MAYDLKRNDYIQVNVKIEKPFKGSSGRRVKLDKLPDETYSKIKTIVDLLQDPNAQLEKADFHGSYTFVVQAGRNAFALTTIYTAHPFSPVPKFLLELREVLSSPHAPGNQKTIKSWPSDCTP